MMFRGVLTKHIMYALYCVITSVSVDIVELLYTAVENNDRSMHERTDL